MAVDDVGTVPKAPERAQRAGELQYGRPGGAAVQCYSGAVGAATVTLTASIDDRKPVSVTVSSKPIVSGLSGAVNVEEAAVELDNDWHMEV